MAGLAESITGRDQHPSARQAVGKLSPLERGMRGPQEVGLRVADLKAPLTQGSGQAWTLLADRLDPLCDQLRAGAQSLKSAPLGDLGDAEVGCELSEQLL